jgi:hypothetical protein
MDQVSPGATADSSELLIFPKRYSKGRRVIFKRPLKPHANTPTIRVKISDLDEAKSYIKELHRELYWKDLLYWHSIKKLKRGLAERETEAAIHYAEILRCHSFLDEYRKNHNLHLCMECTKGKYYVKDKFTDTSLSSYASALDARMEKQKESLQKHGSITYAKAIAASPTAPASSNAATESARKRTKCVAARMFSVYPRRPCQCEHCSDPNFFECEACCNGELCGQCETPFSQFVTRDEIDRCMCRPCREVRNYYNDAHPMLKFAAKNPLKRQPCQCGFCKGCYPTDMIAMHKASVEARKKRKFNN